MGTLRRALDGIRRWWEGDFIPYQNDPHSGVILIGGTVRRHWSARAARALCDFYLRHWQYLWSTLLGIAVLIVAILALKPT